MKDGASRLFFGVKKMERGEPMQFVYRPMPNSKLPDQTIKFDDVWDAYVFAESLLKECRRRGLDHLKKVNRDELKARGKFKKGSLYDVKVKRDT